MKRVKALICTFDDSGKMIVTKEFNLECATDAEADNEVREIAKTCEQRGFKEAQ